MANIMRFGGGSAGKSYGTLPEQISGLAATAGNGRAILSWTNPASDWAGTKIVRKPASCPQSAGDGVTVYDGTAATYTDTGLTNGAVYCYRPFTYNAAKDVQTIMSSIAVTPKVGKPLSALNIGDKIKFGTLYSHKIVQLVANKTDDFVTLITEGIIFCGAYDAKEPSNSDTDRQKYGNNRYAYSNISQWLNSAGTAGNWFTKQHNADTPPSSTYAHGLPYDMLSGYLNQWDTNEINKLQTVGILCGKTNTDGGGVETVQTKVYLPSSNEVGLNTEFSDGTLLQIFSNSSKPYAAYTGDCAANRNGTAGGCGYYWLRTPCELSSTYLAGSTSAHAVDCSGSLDGYPAYLGTIGIRPLCNIPASTCVSEQPDSDGCYILA